MRIGRVCASDAKRGFAEDNQAGACPNQTSQRPSATAATWTIAHRGRTIGAAAAKVPMPATLAAASAPIAA